MHPSVIFHIYIDWAYDIQERDLSIHDHGADEYPACINLCLGRFILTMVWMSVSGLPYSSLCVHLSICEGDQLSVYYMAFQKESTGPSSKCCKFCNSLQKI